MFSLFSGTGYMNNVATPEIMRSAPIETTVSSSQVNAISPWLKGIGDTFETAMGMYGQWNQVQKMKDASGVSQLQNNGTPYVTSNINTQALTPEQMAQATAQAQSGGQWIKGVDNKLVMAGGGLLAVLLLAKVL